MSTTPEQPEGSDFTQKHDWEALGYPRAIDYNSCNACRRYLHTWASPFFRRGYQAQLGVHDALPLLSEVDGIAHLSASLDAGLAEVRKSQRAHRAAATRKTKPPQNDFRWALFRSHRKAMLMHVAWTVSECGFRVASAMAVRNFLRWLREYEANGGSVREAEGWTWAILICVFGLALVLSHHTLFWIGMRFGYSMKQQAISAVQSKLLNLNGATLGQLSIGQIVNILSNDVRRFDDFGPFWTFLFFGPMETAIVLLLISLELGFLPALAGVAALLAIIPVQAMLAGQISRLRARAAMQTDERVRLTGEILEGITSVKMLGWENPFEQQLQTIRASETRPILRMLLIEGSSMALSFFCTPLASFVTFAVAIAVGDVLKLESVFYTVALLHLPRLWLAVFFTKAVKVWSETAVATQRIEAFLKQPEPITPAELGSQGGKPVGSVSMHGVDFSWDSTPCAALGPATAENLLQDPAPGPRKFKYSPSALSLMRHLRSERSQGELNDLTIGTEPEGAIDDGARSRLQLTLQAPAFSVRPGELVAVVGEVGSGKSSLLAALLGELQPVAPEGHVAGDAVAGAPVVVGRMAYCQQIPWIEAGTVRDNIVFGSPFDEAWYRTVVSSCALDHDILHLPAGDSTEIGERGVNLSGGQKARLALARAAYSRPDVCLLDDPLSAVDARVAHTMFTKCIGPQGLMRDSTVILVTHQTQWLPGCDRVLVMRHGQLVADGSWKDLNAQEHLPELHRADGADGASASSLLESNPGNGAQRTALPTSGEPEGTDDVAEDLARSLLPADVTSHPLAPGILDTQDAAEVPANAPHGHPEQLVRYDTSHSSGDRCLGAELTHAPQEVLEGAAARSRQSAEVIVAVSADGAAEQMEQGWHAMSNGRAHSKDREVNESDQDKLISNPKPAADPTLTKQEHQEQGRVRGNVYISYLTAMGVAKGLSVMAAVLLGQASWVVSEWWLAQWAQASPEDQRDTMWLLVYAMLVAAVIVLALARNVSWFVVALAAGSTLNLRMLHHVLHAPLAFFHVTPTGRILNSFAKDQGSVDEQLPQVSFDAIQNVVATASAVVLIGIANPTVLPVLLPLGYFFMSARAYYLANSRQVKRWEAVTRSPVYAMFSATIKGLPTIRAYRVAPRFRRTFLNALDTNGSWWVAYMAGARWVGIRMDVISFILLCAAAILTMCFKSIVSAGLLALAFTNLLQLSGTMQWTVRQTAEAENHMTSVERLLVYCGLEQERARTEDGAPGPPKGWPTAAALEFCNVHARYRPGLPSVLKGLTFSIPSGTTCGVVGRTGSGKSSLLLALFEMIDIVDGQVLLDGLDVKSIGLDALRSQIAIIPQDPLLFSGSIRGNLDPWKQKSDHEVWQVLEHVQLKQVAQQLGGLDAVMSEAGVNFSAGQRQLLCLARSLLTRSRILALDEATANVDRRTDAIIQKALREAISGSNQIMERSMIVIAHRVDTIMDCNKLLVLADGQLVEEGVPSELQERGGVFAEMVLAAEAHEAGVGA